LYISKIKYLLVCLLFLQIAVVSASGTDEKDEIKKNAEQFFQYLELADYNAVSDFLYPKFFDFVPKEQFVDFMKSQMSDSVKTIVLKNPHIILISDVFKTDMGKYALIDYSYQMIMTLNFKNKDDKSFNSAVSAYKGNYGDSNVLVYPKEKKCTVNFNMTKQMFAIKEDKFDKWKFIENTGTALTAKLIPKPVREHFGIIDRK